MNKQKIINFISGQKKIIDLFYFAFTRSGGGWDAGWSESFVAVKNCEKPNFRFFATRSRATGTTEV